MNIYDYIQILFYFGVLFTLATFLGNYMANVFTGKKTFFDIIFKPAEKLIYLISGINSKEEMDWKKYLVSLMIFNILGFFILFLILKYQDIFPFNPQKFKGISWHLALNTAVSFITNTNLAVLFRRINFKLFQSDGRSYSAEFSKCSDWYGCRYCIN